ADPDFARVVQFLRSGHFNRLEPQIFDPLIASITNPGDPWLTAADFTSYVAAQRRAAAAFRDVDAWSRMSILNTAASGHFSSDRTIAQYNDEIWHLDPIPSGRPGSDHLTE
ncbi:MAG: glycogen phosphorylase, partial [Gemmatimonadales bacterium]